MVDPPDAASIIEEKRVLRVAAKNRRSELHHMSAEQSPRLLLQRLLENTELAAVVDSATVFAAYWPIDTEIDPRPLMRFCHDKGITGSLPVTQRQARDLSFRHWQPGQALIPDDYGICVPPGDAEQVVPGLIFLPLLAADRRGNRLGYGAGYYDQALARLRKQHRNLHRTAETVGRPVIAVGLAYDGQLVAEVPSGPTDEAMDWIVTDAQVLEIRR